MVSTKAVVASLVVLSIAVCVQGTGEDRESRTPGDLGVRSIPIRLCDVEPQSKVDKSIDEGTRWLLSAMRPNGMIGADVGYPPDLSCMSMVGLVLVSQGNTPCYGKHHRELYQILDAVLTRAEWSCNVREHQERSLVQRKIGHNADLFLATLFLSQVLGESGETDPEVRRVMEMLVRHVCRSQGKDGTWGDDSWAPVLGTVLGWESLRASHACGFAIDASATKAGNALERKLRETVARDQGWMHSFYKNASSIRVLHSLADRDDKLLKQSANKTIKFAQQDSRPFTQAGGEEYLSFFLVTECFMQYPDTYWEEWYPVVSEKIVRMQNKDGSWSGHHCITDRTFCTAAALLTLQAPNFSLPISDL